MYNKSQWDAFKRRFVHTPNVIPSVVVQHYSVYQTILQVHEFV